MTRLALCRQFGGYSADALADRILDARCRLVITADGVWRGNKLIKLKHITDHGMCRALMKLTRKGMCRDRDEPVTSPVTVTPGTNS